MKIGIFKQYGIGYVLAYPILNYYPRYGEYSLVAVKPDSSLASWTNEKEYVKYDKL